MKLVTMLSVLAMLALALSPVYAQPVTPTAELPICSVLDGRPWMPGFSSGFAVDIANIQNRTARNPTTPPPVIMLGPGSLNDNEQVHAGEIVSLYGMAFFPKLESGGTTGPATQLNGMKVLVNNKPVTLLYAGFRRDNTMTTDNQEIVFAVPQDVQGDKVQFALVSTDMNNNQACRGQNSPFELALNTALVSNRYEFVFPLDNSEAQLRLHGHPVATFPTSGGTVATAKNR